MTDPSDAYPSLTVLGGDQAGASFVLEEAVDNVLIGSDSSCRFHIPVPGVSPVHARIWIDDTGITVYDTSSPEGVYVNDDRVVGQTRLRNGDVIWLGPPGGPQSVLIQCRIPPRDRAAAAPIEAEPVVEAAPQIDDEPVAPSPAAGATPVPPPPAGPASGEFEDDLAETMAVTRTTPPPEPEAHPPAMATPVPSAPPPVTKVPPPPPSRPRTAPPAPPAAGAAAPPARPLAPRPAAPGRAAGSGVPVVRPAGPRPPAPRPRSGGRGGLMIGVGVVVLAALAAGGYVAYQRFVQKPPEVAAQPTPMPPPTPEPMASDGLPTPDATAVDESLAPDDPAAGGAIEEIIPVEPTPVPEAVPTPSVTPKPTPTPRKATPTPTPVPMPPSQAASRVPELLSQASEAYAARRFDAAVGLYDQVLAEDPANAQAQAGKRQAAAASTAAAKSFRPGRTSVRPAGGGGKADLSGFDTSDVKVAKAPDYSGLIEFSATPSRVVPGDAFSVTVTLTNDGKKAYRIQSVAVSTTLNGQASRDTSAGPPSEVRPKATTQIARTSGTWSEDTRSWSMEVVVTSDHGDVFSSRLSWR